MNAMALRAVTVLVVTLLGLLAPGVASAAASGLASATMPGLASATMPGVASATAPSVCRVRDDRLTELSGLAVTRTGYVVVNDGSDDPAARRIFFLDRRCKVIRKVAYPSRPRDTEDLAVAADGTVWVADIGDNSSTRTTIALWRLAPGARKPTLFRLTYPDGAHDAEAMLLPPAGTPIVVTKTVGAAGVYVPVGPLKAGGATPLRQAGTVSVPLTGTSNPFGIPGHLVITGGAVSPDGRRAVLRTYADAFEYSVADGDVVGALTKGNPRVIALPDEPQGESIAFRTDGAALLTVSEGAAPAVLSYPLPDPPTPAPSASPAAVASPAAADDASAAATSPSAVPPSAVPRAVEARRAGVPAGAVITGVILIAAAAAMGILIARRRTRPDR
jgi:hypothetical protein